MQRSRIFFAALLAVLFGAAAGKPAAAAVQVFACEPEWAALAEVIGGARVDAFSATTGTQDPHHITARPSLIAQMRTADLVVCTGAGLESGWLPLLLRQASNPRVLPRSRGYMEVASLVTLREVPALLDRREGDVHAHGNPHIQTDPRHFLPIARALADRLSEIDAAGVAEYQKSLADFTARWNTAIARWQASALPLQGVPVMVQHKNLFYLLDWLGMREVGALEPVPGVAPTTGYLADVLRTSAAAQPRMVLLASYESDRPARWFSERARIPVVVLPLTVGGVRGADTLEAVFDEMIGRLLAGSGQR